MQEAAVLCADAEEAVLLHGSRREDEGQDPPQSSRQRDHRKRTFPRTTAHAPPHAPPHTRPTHGLTRNCADAARRRWLRGSRWGSRERAASRTSGRTRRSRPRPERGKARRPTSTAGMRTATGFTSSHPGGTHPHSRVAHTSLQLTHDTTHTRDTTQNVQCGGGLCEAARSVDGRDLSGHLGDPLPTKRERDRRRRCGCGQGQGAAGHALQYSQARVSREGPQRRVVSHTPSAQ